MLFALSVLGFMSMNLFSMWRLEERQRRNVLPRRAHDSSARRRGPARRVVATGHAALPTVVPFIVLAVATLGLVGPAGSSRYMGFFRELAGSASSVYTTMMFLLGGTFGWLSGVLNDGTLLPVAAMMLGASLTANAISWGLPRRLDPRRIDGRDA